ncbi:MAG: acetyl-CoA carboxylase biotin carboxylase subunit [Pseudomonadota bacterium]
MYKKILIANRGEIALRILRTCKELGIATVAVHSKADADSMHVRLSDESVCIGDNHPQDSYLNIASILTACDLTKACAIHPGIGFLSERSAFAEMAESHNIDFIGPSSQHIAMMGDKIRAKQVAVELGLPVIPGSEGVIENTAHAHQLAKKCGYPVIVKASSGGGGRGMKVAHSESELDQAIQLCASEAKAAFGDERLYMEKFLQHPRHIEVQIIGDGQGGAIHLGERDCSIQRRHQKIIEEACSPVIDQKTRDQIGDVCVKAMQKFRYRGLGTIEFLYDGGEFYFIEMNTRLQVEHTVSEELTRLDLIRMQIEASAYGRLSLKQSDISFTGHAIECRINAEDPVNFCPSPGQVKWFHAPGGPGVRFDSHLYSGYHVPPFYDSLIGKLVVHGPTRKKCVKRTLRALDETVIEGIKTNIELHQRILQDPAFVNHQYDINWLDRQYA